MEKLTYLQDNLKDDKIIRWPDNCFPLRFYIAPFKFYSMQNEGYKYYALVKRALEQWEKVSAGKVKFKVVQTWILHQQYQDENEVYHTILHEIGHSLGLGHSPYQSDIMYTPHRYGVVSLSQRDANSIQWLYKLPYGTSIQELSQKHGIHSSDIDDIIMKISGQPKSQEFENIKNSIKLPQKDLMNEQDTLAELKKYNLGIQNVQISSNVQEYIKKNLTMKKDKNKS